MKPDGNQSLTGNNHRVLQNKTGKTKEKEDEFYQNLNKGPEEVLKHISHET